MTDAGRPDGVDEDSKHLWHGRFDGGPAAALEIYTYSIPYDKRLWAVDIEGSRAHVAGLGRVGLLNDAEVAQIEVALDQVWQEFESGTFELLPADEDIHTAVERRATELSPAAAKMHTGRSRNDQVGTDIRLYLKQELARLASMVVDFQQVLFAAAVDAGESYLPGFTHFQRAQPVPLAHHLLAHGWSFGRDLERVMAAHKASDVSVLGAGALAGSSLPLDPDGNAQALGFSRRFENSIDAVSDRDFIADALYALTMIGIHLSRIGEEWVLWSSSEMSFVTLDDGYATGSSMMPQKKNPDIAELARGKAGRLIGNFTGLLATLKNLPLTYNRDLQEDKEPLFDSLEQIMAGLVAIGGMISTATFHTDVMAAAADDPMAGATDLAEYLVRQGTPFRDAHAVVGTLVRDSLSSGRSLIDLTAEHDDLGADAAALLAPGAAVRNRISPGGAGLTPLQDQITRFESQLAANRSAVDALL